MRFVKIEGPKRSKYSKEEMSAAFDKVEDKDHWKNPILATIHEDDLEVTAQAVKFYTATSLEVVERKPDGMILVGAIGYRQGPAGDH